MSEPYHVLIKGGDAVREVEGALDALKKRGVTREGAGLYKCMYVTRADQTVLMTESAGSALALEMRGRPGWAEPGDKPLNV